MKVLCFFFLPVLLQAAVLEGFSVKKKNFSTELELLTEHLAAAENLSKATAHEVAGAADLINGDLEATPQTNALFLIKSEIYKGLLNNQRLPYQDKIVLSEAIVKSVEQKLRKNNLIYTNFSKWIISSVLSELAPFRADGFLDRFQNVDRQSLKERGKALQLRKAAKFLSPWIIAFNQNSPEKFNQIATLTAVDLLKKISKKTFYFKNFASKHSQASLGEIFAIPGIKVTTEPAPALPSASLKDQSQESLEQGKKALDALDQKELQNPSEVVERLIEKEGLTPEENVTPAEGSETNQEAWKPK